MVVCTLDTSALSELAKPGSVVVRHRLIAEVDAGRIVVLVTWPLMWELVGARAVDDDHYRAMVEVLLRLTGGRVMLSERARRERELRARGPLTLAGFVDHEHRFVPVFDPETVDVSAAKSAGLARGLRFAEAEQAADTVEGLNESERLQAMARGEDVEEIGTAWRRALALANRREKYALDLAESYARDRMVTDATAIGVDVANLSPRDMPTFWSSALIHVARIRAVILGGTSPVGKSSAGQVDLLHLEEAASYANVFVTRDRGLRAFADTVRSLRCEVLSFGAWAARIVR